MPQLRIFNICREGTHVLGPGCRYVIWTQGCPNRCPGCLTPESRDMDGGTVIETEDLAADIILAGHIDGVTISGGEPFMQPEALADLIERVKSYRPELTFILYSGYKIEQLKGDEASDRLLALIDVLIDGPYIESQNDGIGIRGSANQRIILLTDRLAPFVEEMANGKRKVQHILDSNGTVATVGVPPTKMNQ